MIQVGQNQKLANPQLVGQIASLFERAKNDDPQMRRFLALALGRLGDAHAVPALLAYLKSAQKKEAPDPETVYAV
jgi:HEAT repeat protein